MTWDAYHRREDVLKDVAELADRRRDGALLFAETDAGRAFDSADELLLALQMRWHTRLTGAVERELADEPSHLEAAVRRAWRGAAADLPGTRAILDAHDDSPVLARGRSKELAYLATMSGLAGLGDPRAARLGARVRDEARAIVIDTTPVDAGASCWFSRLRHALAA